MVCELKSYDDSGNTLTPACTFLLFSSEVSVDSEVASYKNKKKYLKYQQENIILKCNELICTYISFVQTFS